MNNNFNPFPMIKTKRLVLRQINIGDVNDLFEMRSNPQMHHYTDSLVDKSMEDTLRYINEINKGIELNNWIIWGIEYQETKKVIGTISIWNLNTNQNKAELGYGLMPNYQGYGFMSEALQAVLNYAFLEMGLDSLEAFTEVNNTSSINLLLRNNFMYQTNITEEGYTVNRIFNMKVYKITDNLHIRNSIKFY